MATSYQVEYVYLRTIDNPPRIVSSNKDLQTVVSTSTFAASMSTANFSEPWTFKSERWIGENSTDNLDASQPFSYGTRSCMGRKYDPFKCSIRDRELMFTVLAGWSFKLSWRRSFTGTTWSQLMIPLTGIVIRGCILSGRNPL